MIKSITIQNVYGDVEKYILTNPKISGALIKDVEGLGPPTANITTFASATMDGSVYNMARAEQRNIVFTFILMRNPSIEQARHDIYTMFPLKKYVTITVETDIRTIFTTGYIETVEPSIFSNQEEIQVSVICPYPFFKSLDDALQTTVFGLHTRGFEFPFSNEIGGEDANVTLLPSTDTFFNIPPAIYQDHIAVEQEEDIVSGESIFIYKNGDPIFSNPGCYVSLIAVSDSHELTGDTLVVNYPHAYYTKDIDYNGRKAVAVLFEIQDPKKDTVSFNYNYQSIRNIIFGTITEGKFGLLDFYYNGDEEIGLTVEFHARGGDVSNITFYKTNTREEMHLNTTIHKGGSIFVSTLKGNKYAQLFDNGTFTNLFNALNRDVDWPVLQHGLNQFAFTAEGGVDFLDVIIHYQLVYVGV